MSTLKERYDVRADRGKKNGQFITRKRKAWFDSIEATKKAKYSEESTKVKYDKPAKNRIVDLEKLAERLWCPPCEVALSLKFIEEEYRHGLVSVLKVRCNCCQKLYEIETSRRSINSSTTRERYDLNYKVAAAIIDGGSGASQLNSMLSAMNIPVLTPHFLKRYENEVGPVIEEVATSSCRDAIMKERELTLQAEYMQNLMTQDSSDTTQTPASPSILDTDPNRSIDLIASFDGAWQKRGTGRAYNSKSGHSTLAGHFSGLLMGWTTRTKRCVKCDDHGHSKNDHDCRKNFEGSSKAMEPDMAVELIAKNSLLAETNVRIKTLIGDDDSSTIAAVRRAVSYPIEKWSDLNHAKKSVTTALYGITNSDKIRTYFAHTFVATLKKNKDDASAAERELKSVVDHAFGDHGACNESRSCRTLGTDYVYEGLPHKKPLTDPELRASLVKIFSKAANNAAKLAPCGSTQINENANNMVAYKHPKNYHFAGSASFDYRVAAAVCQKNVGPEYILAVYEKLNLPRGEETEKFRAKRAKLRAMRTATQKSLEYKRRRARNKQTQRRRNTAAENREGITYSTDCGLDAVSDAFQVHSPDEKLNFDEVIPVVFDLETSGLSKSAEICQIAAVQGDNVFNVYIVPSRGMTSGASNVNGLTVVAGEMFLGDERLTTIPIRSAIIDFVEYLRHVSSGKGTILVAHNGSRLDAPMMLRTVKENGLLVEFSSVVKGFSDTLPIFRRIMPDRRKEKKKFNQESLAIDFLGPSAADGAHNAVRDVQILAQLIEATGVTQIQIKEEAKTISEITNSQLLKATHDIIKIGLEPLKNGASPMMRSKMAKAGITYDILMNTFKTGGGESVKMLLAEDVGGRPRVSKQTKILTCIIEELVRLQK